MLVSLQALDVDVAVAAQRLVGAELHRGSVVVRITEVEAYAGPEDTASHARFGRTDRNAPMWGPAGRAYVYQCYGIHQMLNVVTGPPGEAAAVLIRSVDVLAGDEIARRRGRPLDATICAGPGKVGQALGLDRGWSRHPLTESGGLELHEGLTFATIRRGSRIGIDYASARDRKRAWRFADPDTLAVTHSKALRRSRATLE